MNTPKCKDCGQPMFEIGGIGKNIQIMETTDQRGSYITGIREQKLYQCPKCKTIALD